MKVRKAYQARQGRYQADMAIGTMPNLVASLVANRFDMHGPAYTVDAACSSGILAINHSIALLRSGQCDIAVAGGMHTGQSAMFWSAFDMMGAMSRREQIAPFSVDADGLLVGQGGGFVVLKTLRKAREDEDRIYAVIKDTAISSDGAGSHVTVTSVAGQVRVLKQAWEHADMDPEKIGYIEAHGTATPVGDRTEIATLKEFFGDNTHSPALVGSVKSNIGHTMPAAGMIGVIKTALALYHRKIPPTLHCEKPLPAMYESRFLPSQELTDWDEERYPLVAGVNAFGFGGINAHAIMTPYEPPVGAPPQPKPLPWLGEALMISAPNKDALITKLKSGNYTNTGGDYRIVVFSPHEDRIKKAIAIVEKDKPWRGRMDIWFSNQALLANGGKVVFMCPGFGPEAEVETDSISERFGLPFIENKSAAQDDWDVMQAILRDYLASRLCKDALEKLGVVPDMYTGHSVGEWSAARFAQMLDDDGNQTYWSLARLEIPAQYPLVAISGIDCETAERWCAEIPDLYLASDNCPSQVLLCGKQDAIDTLIERLKEERLFHTLLPYKSGFHTPLMPDNSESQNILDTVDIHEGFVPVWSSTTLEPVPSDKAAYAELIKTQLKRPVYFRGLIEKLYAEQNARVFVQIGIGALASFVEDTLKERQFSVIASCVTERSSADQLRRVLAALFIEGREVDAAYLGVKLQYRGDHDLIILPRGAPLLITELPEFTEAVRTQQSAVGLRLLPDEDDVATGDPFLAVASANMQEAVRTQNEVLHLFKRSPRGTAAKTRVDTGVVVAAGGIADRVAAADATSIADGAYTTGVAAGGTTLPSDFTEPLHLVFEDHPYLIDHSIVRQPEGWEFAEDLNLVVPFTMTMELLAEIAKKYASGRKLIRIGKVIAYRWISLEMPFEGIIKGTWKGHDLLELSLEGYAKAEITFGEDWPEPPAEYTGVIDIGEKTMESPSAAELYDRYAFHGPQYQSSTKMIKVASRGLASYAEQREGKGSLLDIMGQQLGLFLHLTQTVNTISFPVRLKELNFYADIFDQEGLFEHTMLITRLTDSSITADMVLTRDGKIWSVARDFVCQRFENPIPVWHVMLKPQHNKLAEEVAPGVYHYANNSQGNILALLSKRYLNSVDRDEEQRLGSASLIREHLISRIALKDAVRDFARRNADELLYPIEIFCSHDEKGRPFVYGHGRAAELVDGICVSLAHKGDEAIAIAAREPVGIDLEKIEEKSEGFWEAAFTKRERELLATLPRPEGAIRFWVAKEACAKKAGTGLEGNPQRFEVSALDGDMLFVGDQKVWTMQVGEEYIAGWTL
ncbi:MAG: acyltransferase domain-containing protein [Coriobacteriales bacterium]|jgi:3-oxoacyl-(acyl-carrier-protein) synthase/malonyl CoA-acyl carrier protein transacylase/phosphopantetheinyl transferase (holo-ACP synthase)|nr:acyltransferase domain-containing protein [Coriobacteriales bacterium]